MVIAIIFDFDGLILETEEATYRSWEEAYASFGLPLSYTTWSSMIGTTRGDFDPLLELQKRVKREVDWDALEVRRRASENAMIEAQPVLPGVEEYLRDARLLKLKIGLASNSSSAWVTRHLTRLGLADRFDYLSTSDKANNIKPDPELYQLALDGLGVSPVEAIALEDSPIGIRSARGAGIFCVAVPNPFTRQLNFDMADFHLESLAQMPLEQLLEKIMPIKHGSRS